MDMVLFEPHLWHKCCGKYGKVDEKAAPAASDMGGMDMGGMDMGGMDMGGMDMQSTHSNTDSNMHSTDSEHVHSEKAAPTAS